MRKILICSLILSSAALAHWQPPGNKTASPQPVPWPGRIPAADSRGYDVLDYDLELEFTQLPPAPGEIAGRCTITFDLLDPPPAALRLDLTSALTVSSVLRDGAPAPFTHEGDSLTVALDGPAGTVTVDYSGRPPRHGPMWSGLMMRQHGDEQPAVGNVSQPYSSHSWFPCKDHPADKATLSFSVTVPDTLTVVATGRLLATVPLDGNRLTWRWRTDHQVATYLVGVAASDYESWYEDCDGVPLGFHVFAEDREAIADAFTPTCEMMRWLGELAGPYPFADEKYHQAQIPWGGAMENQTVSVMGTASMYLPTRSARLVVVHELSHHWFGDALTPSLWRDLWLNEGLARYVECLWLEHDEGPEAYLEYLHLLRPDDLFVGDGLLGDPDPVLPNLLVYDKGAWVIHMLRRYLGDTVFFEALAQHGEQRGQVDLDSFASAWTASTGRDVDAFLAPWLDTEDLPELGVRWRGRLVEVVQQSGADFRLSVPLRVHAGMEVVDLDVRLEGPVSGVEVSTSASIDSVSIDPEGQLLLRTTTTPAPRLLAVQPRPNPARDVVRLGFTLAAVDVVTARVYDLRGRLVRQVDLGVLPEGDGIWEWDADDDGGRRVAAGVYWLELRTPSDRTVRKITLVH